MVEIQSLTIPEVKFMIPKVHRDGRGFFSELYSRRNLASAGIPDEFVQDNLAFSQKAGTLRGLHFQAPPHAQGKLLRVTRGSIFDVAVDIRVGSPTFGRYVSATLDAESWKQIWIPAGFAHGYCTLEPDTEIFYKVTDYYAPDCDLGTRWDDPSLGIQWPIDRSDIIVSDKDRNQPPFRDLAPAFRYEAG